MVSIILATYNYGHFISEALDSIKDQTSSDFECIIIDNGSTDDTKQVVSGYLADNRFSYHYRTQTNVSAARNEGLNLAHGKYVMFLDADDLIEKNKLQAAVQYLEQNAGSDVVYGDMRYFKDPDKTTLYRNYTCDLTNDKPWMPYFSGSGRELAALILKGNIMVISSPLIRVAVLNEVGIFDKDIHLNEDWELWMRMILHQKNITYVDAPLSKTLIRLHKTSLSRDIFRMQLYGLLVLLKHKASYESLQMKREVEDRINEHITALRVTLSKSLKTEFTRRMNELHRMGLWKLVVGINTHNTYIVKSYIKALRFFKS